MDSHIDFSSETVCREDEVISFVCPFCRHPCQLVGDKMVHNSACYTFTSMDVEVYVSMCEIEMDRLTHIRMSKMS